MQMLTLVRNLKWNVGSYKKKTIKIHNNIYNRTFALIKPDAYTYIGEIISKIEEFGFIINNIKLTRMSIQDA